MYVGLIPARHQTLGTHCQKWRHYEAPCINQSTQSPSWLQPNEPQLPVLPAILNLQLYLSQSPSSIPPRCRRPPTHAALPHSARQNEDVLQHRSRSVRDLVILLLQPRKAGCCRIGFEDAPRRPARGNHAGFQHSGWSLRDATMPCQR